MARIKIKIQTNKTMKQTLFIISMVIGSYCWGQKKDSVVIDFNNTYSAGLMGGVVYSPKQDTIKVLMLVCDTMGYPHTSIGSLLPSSQAWNEGRMVWWQFGYEVWEVEYGSIPCTGYGAMVCYGWYRSKLIGQFDQNKKPLPSSIVVWITKEIK